MPFPGSSKNLYGKYPIVDGTEKRNLEMIGNDKLNP
jgi:hypothetical protein